ncbi:hypothetical protein LCGC14_1618660 [marine sediment metagenome]|uniref:Uncharacterized protein n=1 Tax=marine sediment metagenome TaxID=412755 RepID=A0A0F9IT19_9ZZZZ
MIYTANITTVANTAKTALKKTIIRVTKGLVYKVEFYFPAGSAGLMGLAVFDGLFQVWPSSVGEFFLGDDLTIAFDDLYLKESGPFEFQCYTYNTDDTYNHLVIPRIGLVSSEVFMARFMPTRDRQYFKRLRQKILSERANRLNVQRELIAGESMEWLRKQGFGG